MIFVVRAGCMTGCGPRGVRCGGSHLDSSRVCQFSNVVVMPPYANPIKKVGIRFAGRFARSGVLEGARLLMRSFSHLCKSDGCKAGITQDIVARNIEHCCKISSFCCVVELRRNWRRVSVTDLDRIQRHTTTGELELYREHHRSPCVDLHLCWRDAV